jgi:hypothetical protein
VTYAASLSAASTGTIAAPGASLQFYRGLYADLTAVGFGPLDTGTMNQICLLLAGTGSVTLNSFTLGAYASSRTCSVGIYHSTGTVIYANASEVIGASTRRVFTGPWTSTDGICLQLGPDFYNVGVGMIDFSFVSTGTAAPTTVASTTTTLPATTAPLPPNMAVSTLSFTGSICRGGQACANTNLIDQTYGDNAYMDVQYAAGLAPATAGTLSTFVGESWFEQRKERLPFFFQLSFVSSSGSGMHLDTPA